MVLHNSVLELISFAILEMNWKRERKKIFIKFADAKLERTKEERRVLKSPR